MDDEFRSAEERRAAIVALTQKETGIDEAMIETLIRAFYERVRQDALLAPIFESRIAEWEPHLDNMFAFWSSLTLHTGRYHGQPMAKHMPLARGRASLRSMARRCSKRPRATFARPPLRNDSSSARAVSRRASSSASQALTVFSCAKANVIGGKRDRNHLSENSVSRTLPLSPMTQTSVCGLVVFVRST